MSSNEAGESLHPQRIPRSEIFRKTLHVLPGTLPFLFAPLPHSDPLEPVAIQFVVAIAVMITLLYLACHRHVRRENEANFLSTAVSYPATVLAPFILFPGNVEFTCVVVTVIAFGDVAAYIGGTQFGKRRLPWNDQKTWAGTISFVCCAAPVATLAYWGEANPVVPFRMALLCGTTAALAGALAESIRTEVTDNLRIGLAAAAAVIVTHFATVGWFLS